MDFFSSDSADGLNITCTLSTDNQSVFCNGEKYLSEHSKPGPTEYMFYVYLVLYIVLVALAGLFSGLVLGLISLDIVNLEVLVKGGKPRQRKYAKSIIKLVRHQHWLLVTLLIAYAATLEALPICLNAIVDEITAVVVSITAVLLFGEYGALEMRDKTVGTAMTPLDSVYMLNMTDKLDRKKIEEIVNKGFSRIPTYESERSNVVGRILAKQLLRLDPRDASPVKLVEGAYLRPPSCLDTMPLYDLLKKIISDKGQSGHLYLVYEELKDMKETDLVGIITLEDVIEELIGEEIVDETDMYVDVHKRIAAARAKQMYHQFYSTYASPSGAGSSSGVTSSATHDRNNSLGAGSADAVKRKRYGRKGNSHLVQTIKPLDSIPEDQESPISKSMPFSKQKGFGYGGIN